MRSDTLNKNSNSYGQSFVSELGGTKKIFTYSGSVDEDVINSAGTAYADNDILAYAGELDVSVPDGYHSATKILVEKVIWIPGDINETGTDGHIDGITAFIEPGRVLVEINSDKSDPHYNVCMENLNALKNVKDAKGRVLEIDFIYEGDYSNLEFDECRSYINSYLANSAVIVPGYNHERDYLAIETYERIYPDRSIVQVQISDIAIGGGGIHCITQQEPKCS